jgi:hypothetical protein
MSTIYKQDTSHPNWTGRVSRQSRITGYWAHQKREAECTPPIAYVIGIAALVVLFAAAYL